MESSRQAGKRAVEQFSRLCSVPRAGGMIEVMAPTRPSWLPLVAAL
jgi:hypothetical protein